MYLMHCSDSSSSSTTSFLVLLTRGDGLEGIEALLAKLVVRRGSRGEVEARAPEHGFEVGGSDQ